MIDPGNIQSIPINHQQDYTFNMDYIPDFDEIVYDINNEKGFKKFIIAIEQAVRGSFEYKQLISYLKNNLGFNKCAVTDVYSSKENKIKIEIHHHPFTLYDIAVIVFNKRYAKNESTEIFMIAKEVMMLHYMGMVGLIPLCETVHELVHNGFYFISCYKAFGAWQNFKQMYWDYMTIEQKDVITRIEEFSLTYNEEEGNRILESNNVYLDTSVDEYKLPDMKSLFERMSQRIGQIRSNNFMLPEVSNAEYELRKQNKDNIDLSSIRKNKISPIIHYNISKDYHSPLIFYVEGGTML